MNQGDVSMSGSRTLRVGKGLMAAIVVSLGLASAAQAATITVSNTGDSGPGSLRAAIDTANESSSSDTIVFASGVSGRIDLESNLPKIDGPLVISGPGADRLTVSGRHVQPSLPTQYHQIFSTSYDIAVSGLTLTYSLGRVPEDDPSASSEGGALRAIDPVPVDPTIEVSVKGVVFRNNAATGGGAIAAVAGGLSIENSTFESNRSLEVTDTSPEPDDLAGGGAVRSDAFNTVITDSRFRSNSTPAEGAGGAVYAAGQFDAARGGLEVTGSEFTGNTAGSGAGITVLGNAPVSVRDSLISGNTATEFGGGIALTSTLQSRHEVTNTAIAGNSAGQVGAGVLALGLIDDGSTSLVVEDSTITGNRLDDMAGRPGGISGAGLLASGDLVAAVKNTIISKNTPQDITTDAVAGATQPGRVGASFSLIGKKELAEFTETVPGSNIYSSEPVLGPLAANGGPLKTMLPAESSPVVNKGSSRLSTDQRGLPRPVDFAGVPFSTAPGANGADIGAVELQNNPSPPPPPVPNNRFRFGWVKLNKKKGTAMLQVKVPGAGAIRVLGTGTVKKAVKRAKAAATVAVPVKPKGKARKQLRKKGRAKVRVKVRFTPTGGAARTKTKTVKLVKKRAKKRRR
jgi:hypothetical protein